MDTIEARYDELLVKAMLIPVTTPADFETAVRAALMAAHDDACIECHNTDMQARCPRRASIDSLGNEEG